MDIKFKIEDRSETELGTISVKSNTIEFSAPGLPVYGTGSICVTHKTVFDADGFQDAHFMGEVEVQLSADGDVSKFIKMTSDRASFYNTFEARGFLFKSIVERAKCKEESAIDIVNSVRKFICEYCEQNEIDILFK